MHALILVRQRLFQNTLDAEAVSLDDANDVIPNVGFVYL